MIMVKQSVALQINKFVIQLVELGLGVCIIHANEYNIIFD